jgi:LPS-assembly protein
VHPSSSLVRSTWWAKFARCPHDILPLMLRADDRRPAMRALGQLAVVIIGTTVFAGATPVRAQDTSPFSNCRVESSSRFLGNRLEPIEGRPGAERVILTGDVSIRCDDVTLFADEVSFENDTKRVSALGHVTFQQPDVSIYAERAEIDGTTKLGTFYQARGTARMGDEPVERSPFGTAESDIMFEAEELSRTGPRGYRLRGGRFTACVQATPRWEMVGSDVSIQLDRYVLMRNMVFKVKDVPLLYWPVMYYPINKEDRSTGFLLPSYASSTIGGAGISNAFFWAINRSQDATFYHDWNAKSGQGFKTEYRYVVSPASQGQMGFHQQSRPALRSSSGAIVSPSERSYRVNGNASQSLPRGFRLSAAADYFTSVSALQRHQNTGDYSQRTRSWNANLSGNINRVRVSSTADVRDFFYGTSAGQRSGRLPSVSLTLNDSTIGQSRIYYGASGEVGYLLRQDTVGDPTTDRSLWRMHAAPTIRAPLSRLPYLSATGSATWQFTRWLESKDPVSGRQVPVALTRQLLDMRASVTGPVLSRVFQTPNNGYAERFKHLIEPSFTIQRTTAFRSFDRVVVNDYGIDGLVGGTTSINYRLSNKLLARRRAPEGAPGTPVAPGIVREILSVELGQSYHSDARAAFYDTNYQSSARSTDTKGTFTALLLTAVSRPTDVASAQFRMEIDPKYRQIRELGASGLVQGTRVSGSAGWTKRLVIPGLAGFDANGSRHTLNSSVSLSTTGNRLGGSYGMSLDIKNGGFTDQRITAYYTSQCCGISFDWQALSTPLYPGIPTDRRFGVSFSLAGIGSFSNPMGAFGGPR